MAEELRHAFAAGELVAFFQPQVDLASGRIVALEALCRWMHPQRGLLLPDRFIAVAERFGLMAELGRVMLEESARRAAGWYRRGVAIGLALNASPSELHPDFAATVLARVESLGLPAGAVTVEITESPALQESCDEIVTLQALVDGGVGVSIDDFGAGHTTLEALERLPFTEVKIDRSLVHDDRPEAARLVAACVQVAHRRSALVVAEGVETDVHLARAREWGCDRAQGFLFSGAVPPDEVDALLARA
ncbi:EAL domain-containing protein [Agromyces sp. MMS24-K17]|uniref:EAL domain-containing protein n=1 Tax=Agromyces sp. MMS24-K17 TaxID=3372850 RepID=UPI003754C7D8